MNRAQVSLRNFALPSISSDERIQIRQYSNSLANGVKISITRAVDDSKPILVRFLPDCATKFRLSTFADLSGINRTRVGNGIESSTAHVADIFAHFTSGPVYCPISLRHTPEFINSVRTDLNNH